MRAHAAAQGGMARAGGAWGRLPGHPLSPATGLYSGHVAAYTHNYCRLWPGRVSCLGPIEEYPVKIAVKDASRARMIRFNWGEVWVISDPSARRYLLRQGLHVVTEAQARRWFNGIHP
jgi:hypothetical protein